MGEKTFKVGDRVWFWEPWVNQSMSGVIARINIFEPNYAYIKRDEGGETTRYFNDLFPTEKKLLEFRKEKDDQLISQYKSEINNIEDLIKFMYDNVISTKGCGYTNYCARTAVREKAKELLNIELE